MVSTSVSRALEFVFWPLLVVLQSVLYTFAQKLFFAFLKKTAQWGAIELSLPDEKKPRIYGDLSSNRKVAIRVKDKNSLHSLIWKSVTQDLTLLFRIMLANREQMDGLDTPTAWLSHLLDRLSHLQRANTLEGSRKNIHSHYDLSNELFQLFLDKTMTYSSAIFKSESETLEAGQLNKIRAIISKADIQREDHVLEIGTGWGSFAIEAVKATGCRVTSITLSMQQKQLAEERIRSCGLSDRIEVLLMDYRNVTGKYDKIVSIEMLEAVGHEYLPVYFASCWKLLKPGGRMVLQVITTPNLNYETYRRGCDFIQKYIFPGTLCPSVNAVFDAIEKGSKFSVESAENIGYHYARTLREWRRNFLHHEQEVLQLGFDAVFIRKWIYYFCYCEAGFENQYLGDYQIVLTVPRYLSSA